ncbi:MAG: ATP-dependent DNA helicase RecG [Thermoleophilia bacterium]|nr:ATP-dependent DNA helicase RecG [Thermoleophilia bacterium]
MDQGAPRPRPVPDLERSVETLPGVGPKLRERLASLGIATLADLARHVPRAYLDWAQAGAFGELRTGEEATVACTVERARVRPTRRRNLRIVEATVKDAAGGRATALWFNQAWLAERLQPGTRLLLHGELQPGATFKVERHEFDGDAAGLHTVGLVPLYTASDAVSTARLRELTEALLPLLRRLPDPVPASVRAVERLPLRSAALAALHRPLRLAEVEPARRRLAFDELLVLLCGLAERRRALDDAGRAAALPAEGELVRRLRETLPFALTPDQEQAIAELRRDLARTRPMLRLLQGDVGSGKTVVALYALLRAVEAGHQGALMAPTETLAEQHFLTIDELAGALGVRTVLLTSSLAPKAHAGARDAVARGAAELVVGTHALIQEEVAFRSLAVAVVDEQHRFGVEQRRALARAWPGPSGGRDGEPGEAPLVPHVLHMTATPIPRTLAHTVYGDLDVTEIARPPSERKPVVTAWVTHDRSAEAYVRLRRHLEQGRQAYVVCPLVSESETIEARAAEEEAERLRAAELAGFRVGCLHGRLGAAERRSLMAGFKRRELDVLVSTTVIEVGVDVPNATIMIVQEADRFGLAQLHQLRGRVGRGGEQSYCLLVSRPKEELTEAAQARLQALVDTTDGFALAEVDLELRGEGELLGTRQSGLPDLRFARLARDRDLIAAARRFARVLEPAPGDPLRDEVERFWEHAHHRGLA